MLIFYSGEGAKSDPEITLQDEACMMMTYALLHGRERSKRLNRIIQARKAKKKKAKKASSKST